jgi:hypothetical protein
MNAEVQYQDAEAEQQAQYDDLVPARVAQQREKVGKYSHARYKRIGRERGVKNL